MLTIHERAAAVGSVSRCRRHATRRGSLARVCSAISVALLFLPSSAGAAAEELIRLPSAPNEQIRQLARQVRTTPGGTRGKLDRIIDLIFSERNGLGFTYQARPTLTAAQAVEARAGNCLSLVNLSVSIARSAGINVKYIEVEDFESFYRHQGTIVRTTHVIGGTEISGNMMYIDFLPRRQKPYRRLQPISDRRAAALFYNALAAEAILAKNHELAEQQFQKALEVDNNLAETWNNYAVLQRREGELETALAYLKRAHKLDSRLLPAIENLAGIYRRSGQIDESRKYEALAMKEKTKNPYFLLHKGLEHLGRQDYEEAENLLQRARRLESGEPEIYVALGRIELHKGNKRAANKLFRQAQKRSLPRTAGFQLLLQKKIDLLLAGSEQPSEEAEDT